MSTPVEDNTETYLEVACENECEEGFDIHLFSNSIQVTCRGCTTEYTISPTDLPGRAEAQ